MDRYIDKKDRGRNKTRSNLRPAKVSLQGCMIVFPMNKQNDIFQVVDFTAPFISDKYYIFMAKPKKAISFTTFIDVFESRFWGIIILFSTLGSVVLYVFLRIAKVSILLLTV